MTAKLLTEHHLEFLSLKRVCTGSSESYTCQNATLLEITCHGSKLWSIILDFYNHVINCTYSDSMISFLNLIDPYPSQFHFKGVKWFFVHFSQILIEHSKSKQWRHWSAVSDLGLRCVPMSNKKNASRLIWVKGIYLSKALLLAWKFSCKKKIAFLSRRRIPLATLLYEQLIYLTQITLRSNKQLLSNPQHAYQSF